MAAYVFVAAVLAFAADPQVREYGFPIVTSFTTDQIGADPATFCVTQGPDGVLYFGGNGLLTFDGDRWHMNAAPGLSMVTQISLSPSGRIWVGAQGEAGWFDRQPNSTWQYHSVRPFIEPGNAIEGLVAGVFADDNDGATIVTNNRVYRWDGHRMRNWPLPGIYGPRCFQVRGEVWVQSFGSRIYRITANGPEVVTDFPLGVKDEAMLLWISGDSREIVFGTRAGLFISENGKLTRISKEAYELLFAATINSVARLPDGRILFCTGGQGIVCVNRDGTMAHLFEGGDGMPPHVQAVFVDREQLLWAVSSTGVQRINLDPATRVFDERARLPSRPYRNIAVSNRRVVVGNVQGVFTLDDEKHCFNPVDVGSVVEDVAALPNGFVVASRRSVSVYNESGVRQLAKFSGDVRAVLPSRTQSGETLVAEYGRSIYSVANGRDPRRLVDGLPVIPSSLAEDDDGHLWIGTDTRGVYVAARAPATPGAATPPDAAFGLPEIVGAAWVRSSPQGDVFVIASGGAWVKRSGTPRFVAVRDFPTRPVTAVSPCLPDGTLWVAHAASGSYAACVARISFAGEWQWSPHSIADLDTIGPPRSICGETDDAGRTVVWIGGSKAVLRHVLGGSLSAPRPAAPLLKAFTRNTDGNRQPITEEVPYSTAVIDFEFAEPQFARRALLHLETRIDGIDSGWVPANRESRRELNAIRDGRYVFKVRAVAETGVVSEPTVFTFNVAPPWWRTPRAIVLEFILGVTLVYIVHRLRIRHFRQRNALLEDKVRERTEELAEASAAKTLFVANMSHDIRNPLNGIVGLALALEDTRLDHQQREIVATLRECTTYLSSLVDDVLDFASIEAGRVELRPGPFVPSELLNSVVTTLKAEAAERGAFITIETDPEVPPMLHGDAGRIQQILVNYVSNALKYAGGHIRVAATIPHGSAGEIEFYVADEGPGISAAEQATLFTKFSRLDGARRSHVPGTGLGLASCRLLADIMGGAVGVESHDGKGARFFLRLPLSVATEPAPAAVDVTLPHASVLLVEDTDYNAMAATAVLRRLGLSCDRARTGAEAVQLFTEKRHNIVLLDRNLPDMDGTDVARRLRELETDGMRSVLLAVTAYCSAGDRDLCIQAGMDAFVGKPLTPEKLRRVLVTVGRRLLASASIDAPHPGAPATSKTPAPADAGVDTTLLEYLADGAEGGLAGQIERFVAALAETHEGVRAALARKASDKELGDAAHRVLGQARMIGATGLLTVATEIEAAARRGDTETVTAAMPRLANEVAALTAALRRGRPTPTA